MSLTIWRRIPGLTLGALLMSASVVNAQNPRELFERARMLDESNQNLSEAIKLYSQVVNQANEQRALAARAQYRMAVLYDRLGRKADAQRNYQAVVTHYSDQAVARQARARIVKPGPAKNSTAEKVASSNGLAVRRLWSGDGVDLYGSPSPDGRYVSFTDWSTGDLAIRDLTGGSNQRITNKGTWSQSNQFAEYSRISTDGRQVAYAWFNDKGFYDLRIVDVDGRNPRILHSNPELKYIRPWAWFPDGKHLVAVFSRSGPVNQIVLVSTANGSVRTLKTLDWRVPLRLSVSSDARWIAYDFPPLEDSPKNDIYLLSTDSTRELRLVEHPAHDRVLGWSPDGERLVFASDRTGTISIWSLRVRSGNPQGVPELIRPDVGQITPLGLARDGSLYYGTGDTRDVLIGQFDAATGNIHSSKNASDRDIGANAFADWSHDGEQLAYLSQRVTRSGTRSRMIVIRSLKTGAERELIPKFTFRANHRSGPRWSPDGRFLLVVGSDEKNRFGIYRINTETAEVSPVVQVDPGLSYPDWTADGKVIYSRRTDRADANDYLVMRDPETAEERILHKSRHIHVIAISPDKQYLAFATELEPTNIEPAMSNGLMILRVSGGQPKELLRLPATEEVTGLVWSPEGRGLFFITGDGKVSQQRTQVFRISVGGGKPEPVKLELPLINGERHFMGLRFHPDGKRVAFTDSSNATAEILVMENFLPSAPPRKATASRR